MENRNCKFCSKILTKYQKMFCCRSHARINNKNWLGKKHSLETIKQISKTKTGHITTKETKRKISKSLTGLKQSLETKKKRSNKLKGHPNYLKHQSLKARRKIRKYITKKLGVYKGFHPNYNNEACKYFQKFDEKNNTKGQYATNGGEFYVKELGYWLDYINFEKKLIIEWDERNHHYLGGKLKQKDKLRQKEIQKLYFDFKFVRIKDFE
jgi:hypothetical protein